MAGVIFDGKTVAPAILVEKEIVKTKFGASVDTFLGEADENGTLNQTTWTGALNFAGVKTVGVRTLYYAFYDCTGLTSVDLSSLQVIDIYGLSYAFYGCTGITGALDLSSLQNVGSSGMQNAFNGCTGITSVDFSSLQRVGSGGLQSAFYGCNKIAKVSFPLLTDVQKNSFGALSSSTAFYNCTGITEIHFRADMQATIETITGYSNKFGATNATIYFDL